MTSPPMKPWENNQLQNSSHMLRNSNSTTMSSSFGGGGPQIGGTRSAPPLPPLPRPTNHNNYNSYMPYSNGFGYGGGYGGYSGYGGGYSGYGSYNSYNLPYRSSSMYGGYGGFNDYNNYSMDDAERRFIQYCEERSRNAFANFESIVRVFNSISMMLDNTFFAMTNSFRAVLSMAESFGKLKNMFGYIWHSVNLFKIFNYLYRKLLWLLGKKVPSNNNNLAWNQAIGGNNNNKTLHPNYNTGTSWTAFAFLGFIFSAPYIISKFLPKYEDKGDPSTWKSSGVKAKAAFDFAPRAPNELPLRVNDEITLAPTYIQEEMNLKNTGWAFAVSNDNRSGVVPLNYLVLVKRSVDSSVLRDEVPIPRATPPPPPPSQSSTTPPSTDNHNKTKRVSFGENQIFENVDLEDYVSGKKEINDNGNPKECDNKIENEVPLTTV